MELFSSTLNMKDLMCRKRIIYEVLLINDNIQLLSYSQEMQPLKMIHSLILHSWMIVGLQSFQGNIVQSGSKSLLAINNYKSEIQSSNQDIDGIDSRIEAARVIRKHL